MALELQELRSMSDDELKTKAEDLKKKLMEMRIQLHTGKLEQFHQIKELKKDIARVLSVQNQVQLNQGAKGKS